MCKIISGLLDISFQVYSVVLTCNEEELIKRWENDALTEWRNDEKLLQLSISSLADFNCREKAFIFDTSELSADMVAQMIIDKIEE